MLLDTDNLITVYAAADLFGKTYRGIALQKAKEPDQPEKGKITWYKIGNVIMLDQETLFEVAIEKRWMVSDGKVFTGNCVDCKDEFPIKAKGRHRIRCDKCSSRKASLESYRRVHDVKPENIRKV